MQFTAQVITLFSVLSSTVFGADVYSSFLDANGAEIGTTNFDVGNDGCFSIDRASQVSFSQSGPKQTANGPYCLHGYTEGGCPGVGEASQTFQNVDLDGRAYMLNQGLNGAASYKWNTNAC